MVRRCAGVAFGLALLLALSCSAAFAPPGQTFDSTARFSSTGEPAAPAIKAGAESKAVSTGDPSAGADGQEESGPACRGLRVMAQETVEQEAAPRTYPPLLHRPPPLNS